MSQTAILCVDDERAILDSLRIELENFFGNQYLIEIAQSGEEALEVLIELLKDRYEVALVISDYIMPGIKGDELLKRIHLISPRTLKIMLTGQADLEAVANAINYAKLYRYIPKPWHVQDLTLTVKEAVRSYFKDKQLAEQNQQLMQMNLDLEQLTREQSKLIVKLHTNECYLKQQTEELFQLNKAFSRFVPQQFLQLLNKSSIVDIQLGEAVQQKMSVLFSDIRDFTKLSESMKLEDNFKFINAYLSRMEPAINENQGFIDKYIGDAIMALFQGSADCAVKAGIAMLHTLNEYNQERQSRGDIPIQIGIGINTGSLMLGTVGGENRMDGTVISDAVNVASRIEALTKNYGVSMLISHFTFMQLQNPENYAIRAIDRVQVKGKSETVSLFEVFDADQPEIREGKLATSQTFTKALLLFKLGKLDEAEQLFADCLQQNPGDRVAQIYRQRCQQPQ
jgi:class 3 adenylate cyclase/FixJ family two-component response regulator